MALNKKQKKRIDAARKKMERLRQLLKAARMQPDDPDDIPRLEAEIRAVEDEIEKIRNG